MASRRKRSRTSSRRSPGTKAVGGGFGPRAVPAHRTPRAGAVAARSFAIATVDPGHRRPEAPVIATVDRRHRGVEVRDRGPVSPAPFDTSSDRDGGRAPAAIARPSRSSRAAPGWPDKIVRWPQDRGRLIGLQGFPSDAPPTVSDRGRLRGTTGLRLPRGAATMPAVRTAEFPSRRRVAAKTGSGGPVIGANRQSRRSATLSARARQLTP